MFLGLEDDCFVSNSYGRGFFSQSFCTVKPWMPLFYVYSRSSQVWTQTKNYGPLHRQLILNVIRPNGKRSIPDLHLLHKNNLWKFTRTYQNPPPPLNIYPYFLWWIVIFQKFPRRILLCMVFENILERYIFISNYKSSCTGNKSFPWLYTALSFYHFPWGIVFLKNYYMCESFDKIVKFLFYYNMCESFDKIMKSIGRCATCFLTNSVLLLHKQKQYTYTF